MSNTYRIIHTNLCSNKAKEVLDAVLGQLSDGWGENSNAYDKYWRFCNVERDVNGEVLIKISTEASKTEHWGYGPSWRCRYIVNAYTDMSDDQVKAWFAKMIKKTMQMELKDNEIQNGWKRDNTADKTCYLNYHETINVAEVYALYDYLNGRELSGPIFEQLRGKVRSESEAKKVKQLQAKRKDLEDKHFAAVAKYEAEVNAKIKELEEQMKCLKNAVGNFRSANWRLVKPMIVEIDEQLKAI